MIIDFSKIEELAHPNFKGGEKDYHSRMFSDDRVKIMKGRLTPGASIGLHTHTTDMEVILLSHDHSVKGALRYIELFSIPFPAVMYESKDRAKLPGAPDNVTGLPYIVIVDAQGNVVHSGHATTAKDWRVYTNKTN